MKTMTTQEIDEAIEAIPINNYFFSKGKIARLIFETEQQRDYADSCFFETNKEDFRNLSSMNGCLLYTLLDGFTDEEKEELYELSKEFNNE